MSRLNKLIHYPLRPRFYYGWAMAPIATLGLMCTAPAQTYGVSVFTPFFRASLDLSPAEVAGAYMFGTFFASLPLTFVGSLMDRYGPRRTMFFVVCSFSLACVLLSQVSNLVSLFAAFFLLRLFGQGSLGMISGSTLAFWFHRRLGIVSGLNATGSALTIAFAPRIHLLLIEHIGWRAAYLTLGVVVAMVLLPLLLLFYRNHPEDVGQRMDALPVAGEDRAGPIAAAPSVPHTPDWTLAEAFRTRAYWIASACLCLWGLIGTAVAFCSPSIFEARGLTSVQAAERTAVIFTAMGLTLMFSNIITGWLADRAKLHRMLCVGMLAMSLIGWLLRMPGSERWVIAIGCAMGVSQAIMMAVSSTIWVRYFGRTAMGRIRGSVTSMLVAASSVGPFLVDGVSALMDSYYAILTIIMLLPLPLAFLAGRFAARPKSRPACRAGDRPCSKT